MQSFVFVTLSLSLSLSLQLSSSILCKCMHNIFGEPMPTLSFVTGLEPLSLLIVGSDCSFFQETLYVIVDLKKCDLTLINPVQMSH